MNNRLKELYTEVVGRDKLAFDSYLAEKFAELIVRECAGVADDWYRNHDKIHSDPMSYVLAHFGVEE